MNHLDLFSGIGGFALGAQMAGINTIGFCEIDEFPCAVLSKRFPHIHNYGDIRKLDGTIFRDFHGVDIITGGFPCTDLSNASYGSHKGLGGEKSGLFYELARVVIECNPKWVFIENVPSVIKYIDTIKQEMPFHDWTAKIFDARIYGAKCRRKRCYLVGCSERGGARKVFDLTKKHRQIVQSRGNEDVFPMCLPWGGGVSLERLGSCVVENTEINTTRIRASDGLPRKLDGRRYLALANAIVTQVAYQILRSIVAVDKESP